jgi:hypothetical protein
VAIDGQRYYSLFDDAMISMRYAWNFAHGLGLVWNAGQRVEGYSNLLMTLGMSLAALFLDKKLAVLAVQIAGVPTTLITACVAWRIAADVNKSRTSRGWLAVLAFASVLFYYPLNYWTLMGMETGLLTLFLLACSWFGLRWARDRRAADLIAMSSSAALAFLTRNDSLVLSAMVFGYVTLICLRHDPHRKNLRQVAISILLLALTILGQTAFRYVYYGNALPNTYALKLTGIPLAVRVIGGSRFVLEFLLQSWPVLGLALIGLLVDFGPISALLASLMAAAIGYQIYAGGDPWPSWRLLAPAMPAMFILAAGAAAALVTRWRGLAARQISAGIALSALTISSLVFTDIPFLTDMQVRGPTSAAIANRVNTDAAIAISSLTGPEASVGVIWAGTLPYYAGRNGVDFLGKSDPYIAHLVADISGSVSWSGMISVPGHNKYDLEYSIVRLQPTYAQAYAWGYQTVKPWFVQHYARVEYHGPAGMKTVFLLKDSPLVCWEVCRDEYRIIPWPGQK